MQESSIKYDLSISIIIPVLNEEEWIIRAVNHLSKVQDGSLLEILVVDGNQKGNSLLFLRDRKVITIKSEKGRARQMNSGARRARGDILLFLHTDTFLPDNAFEQIISVMKTGKYVGGAFDLGFDSKRWVLKLIAAVASMRSRITRIPFGDQAVFIKRRYFEKIGGFSDIPLMEDLDLMKRTRRRGFPIYISPLKVTTSARKWEEGGVIYTTLRNWFLQFFYFCGVSPERLVGYYYKREGRYE
jgi:rSAM/selenodomain-associated transferase 2